MERFEEVVARIRHDFPDLIMELTVEHPHVHAMADIPVQPGLPIALSINLQNCDELHLSFLSFWVEWFPCGNQAVFDRFVGAVTGVISGRCRLLESHVLGYVATSRLQVPADAGTWTTIASSNHLLSLLPWPREHRVVELGRDRSD